MGTSDQVLKENINKALEKLDEPVDVNCQAHGALADGVKVLLQIQKAILEGKVDANNSIKMGNFTVTGTAAIAIVVAGYCALKVHGAI